mmetsp:Transcript_10362/g.18546  ORF Transcript_10362/g.18546 Transcript_10362/m.18546 type:complete len:190 (+) Transcript_10362:66-635(+)
MMHKIWGGIDFDFDDDSESKQILLDRALQDPRIQWCDELSDSEDEEQPTGGVQHQVANEAAKVSFGGACDAMMLSQSLAALGAAKDGSVQLCAELDEALDSHSTDAGSNASQSSESNFSADLPSVGSAKHGFGCTPCYFFARARCHAGEKCRNCHFQHAKLYRPGKRRGEKQRRAMRVVPTGGEDLPLL